MEKSIQDNAEWLSRYDNRQEILQLTNLEVVHNLQDKQNINVIDIGCGNGRSIKLVHQLFPFATIRAVDRIKENIEYAQEHLSVINANMVCSNIFDYLLSDVYSYDLALFSWSFFDMVNIDDHVEKTKELELLLNYVLDHLNYGGVILVLQPTKGGMFEKLLSLFIPTSDEDYLFTHHFLLSHGFVGPKDSMPDKSESLAIWSEFLCFEDDDLFRGISSILKLETGKILTRHKFNSIMKEFRKIYELTDGRPFALSDCVNIYYKKKESVNV